MTSTASIQAALEQFRAGGFAEVVDLCGQRLKHTPSDIDVRLLLARALVALQQEREARNELRTVLKLEPESVQAYRLLGELAMRAGELASADLFLKEALRIDAGDQGSVALLRVLNNLVQPTAVVEKLPAATAAVGCHSSFRKPRRAEPCPPRLASGTEDDCAQSGFGAYLVRIGMLSESQLDACLALQERDQLRIGDAAVELGFVSSPKLEWASLAYHASRPRT